MQSEIDDIRTACNVAEILHDSEQGMTTLDFRQFIRCVRSNLDLIEAQQAHGSLTAALRDGRPGEGTVNLPVLTLAQIGQAAARAQGRRFQVIEGGRHG